MIIQCEKCETRFRLDESRMPPQGARVRCSRCKTAFFVAHPDASAQQALDEVVAEATSPGGPLGPGTTEDLFDPTGTDFDATAANENERTVAGPDAAAADDEQWEFEDSDAVRPPPDPPEPPGRAAAPAVAPPAEPAPPASDEPATAETVVATPTREPRPAPEPAAPRRPPAPARVSPAERADASALDLDAGLDPMAGPDPSLAGASPQPSLPALDDPDDWGGIEGGLAGGTGPDPGGSDTPGVEPDAGPDRTLFGDSLGGEPQAAEPQSADLAGALAQAASSEPAPARNPSETAVAEAPAGTREVDAPGEAGPAASTAPARRRTWPGRARVANLAAWAASVLLFVGGVALSLVPSPPPMIAAAQPRTFVMSHGEARDVRGRFVDNAWTGPVFLVSGTYVPTSVPPGTLTLRLHWLDADGGRLATTPGVPDPPWVAGAELPVPELRQLTPVALVGLLGEAPPDFRRGGNFDIVVPDVPEAAADFGLELELRAAPPRPPEAEPTPGNLPAPETEATASRRPTPRPSSA